MQKALGRATEAAATLTPGGVCRLTLAPASSSLTGSTTVGADLLAADVIQSR